MDFDFSKIKEFDWDFGNLEHIKKHDVSKDECEEVFLSKAPLITEDETHSQLEERYRVYGRARNKRSIFMIITIRSGKIRVISARDQSKKERKELEKIGGDKI